MPTEQSSAQSLRVSPGVREGQRLGVAIPAWVSVLAGWVLGGAVGAAIEGSSEDWLLAWFVLLLCWIPMLRKLQRAPRRHAALFGLMLGLTIAVVVLARPFDEWAIRLALEIVLTVPAAYWLLDRPRPAA